MFALAVPAGAALLFVLLQAIQVLDYIRTSPIAYFLTILFGVVMMCALGYMVVSLVMACIKRRQ